MDYAIPGRIAFITRKDLSAAKSPSPSAQAKREFIRSHDFSVTMNADGNPRVVITRK